MKGLAALAAVCLLTAPAFGADHKAEARAALADARQDLADARSALEDSSRYRDRIAAGDWSGVMTIEGDKIIKCGDPSEYPGLNCQPYSEAEKAAMLEQQTEALAEARHGLSEAEAGLASAEAALAE